MLSNQDIDPRQTKPPFVLWRPWIAVWRWLFPPTLAHRDRQHHLTRRLVVATALLVFLALCGLLVWQARPLYDAYQEWEANRLVGRARALVDQGEVYQGISLAQKAYGLAPENLDAIRLNAEFRGYALCSTPTVTRKPAASWRPGFQVMRPMRRR